MGTTRTAWHVMFVALLEERAPPGVDVRSEVPLTNEPQRADLLLLRRAGASRADDRARVLRGLWPVLSTDTLVEFKSPSRPYRRGDLVRLLGYGAQYHAGRFERLCREDLALVLVVVAITPTLRQDIAQMDIALEPRARGYWGTSGWAYPTHVVELDEVADAEQDELLALFGRRKMKGIESARWWEEHVMRPEAKAIKDLEGYREMRRRILDAFAPEERVDGLSPQERLAGLAPEERLAGLAPQELVLSLPDEVVRSLSDDFLATLPPDIQERLRRRVGR